MLINHNTKARNIFKITDSRASDKSILQAQWQVISATITAKINDIRHLQLTVACSQNIAPQLLLGSTANLSLATKIHFRGIIHQVKLKPKTNKNQFLYLLKLYDYLGILKNRIQTQVFRLQNSKSIIDHITKAAINNSFQMNPTAPTNSCCMQHNLIDHGYARPWIWQWQQSDLQLIQKLCSAESWIFYSRFNPSNNNIISNYYLFDNTSWLKESAKAINATYNPCQSLRPQKHKHPIIHNIELIVRKSQNKQEKIIKAQSNNISWEIGQWITISTTNKTQTLLSGIISQKKYYISQIEYQINTKENKNNIFCSMEINSHQRANNKNKIYFLPSYYDLIPATIIATNANTAEGSHNNCPAGFYGIQYDHEATTRPPKQPYVPLLCRQINNKTPRQASYNKLTTGSRVLIKMIQGDFSKPIIIGAVNSKLQPSPLDKKGRIKSIMRSPGGHTLSLEGAKNHKQCSIYTAKQQQGITICNNHKKDGISIYNKQGSINKQAYNYILRAKNIRITTKHKTNIEAKESLQIICEQKNISWKAKNITIQSMKNITKQSTKQKYSLHSNTTNWIIKNTTEILSTNSGITFYATNRISTSSHKHAKWQADKTAIFTSGASKIQATSSMIDFNAAQITITCATIQVHGT